VKTSLFFRRLAGFPFLRRPVVVLVVIAVLTLRNGDADIPMAPLTGIHEAAERGDLEKVKMLLKNNPDSVFSKDPRLGRTPLFYAADADHENVVEFLLANKAEVNANDVSGLTALDLAADRGNTHVVKILLANGADVNAGDNGTNWTPLLFAAYSGKIDVAELLLANHADIEARTSAGWTPLLAATQLGHKDTVELLLAKGADINAKANDGQTPLDAAAFAAAFQGNKDVVELLLANKPKRNIQDAVLLGDVEEFKALLRKNPDLILIRSHNLSTLLHFATFADHKDVAELLLADKADVNAKDKYGDTPLHSASTHGYKDVAELLLVKGADVNSKDIFGQTPLQAAVVNGHQEVAELLREQGGHE
jgi:ankyrin repeat protein